MKSSLIAILVAVAAFTPPTAKPKSKAKPAKPRPTCVAGSEHPLGSAKLAYAAIVKGNAATAYATPGGKAVAVFGAKNDNGYPTVFGISSAVVAHDCHITWYRAELPMRPNGTAGYVRPAALHMGTVDTRIEVDLSQHRLTLSRKGTAILTATVAVGSSATPTPVGRFYVNQRIRSVDASGPYGPVAIGVSAFSNVLTGWAQGGPIGIHGTNEPWSIGHSVSNGCIRLPNATIEKLFRLAPAGTPVVVHP
jgi:lipoprotein-anchoring transpeptidase ErfK/SrfK